MRTGIALFFFYKVSSMKHPSESASISVFKNLFPHQDLKEAFRMFDKNNDGFIDLVELRKVLCILSKRTLRLKLLSTRTSRDKGTLNNMIIVAMSYCMICLCCL